MISVNARHHLGPVFPEETGNPYINYTFSEDGIFGIPTTSIDPVMSTTSSITSTSRSTTSSIIHELKVRTKTPYKNRANLRRNQYPNETEIIEKTVHICGNTDKICSIEYDLTKDDRPDCCNPVNNIMCIDCFSYCKDLCGEQGFGVKTCFSYEDTGITCDCSDKMPTCYKLVTTTTIAVNRTVKIKKTATYIWIILSILLAGTVAMYYIRQLK